MRPAENMDQNYTKHIRIGYAAASFGLVKDKGCYANPTGSLHSLASNIWKYKFIPFCSKKRDKTSHRS